MFAMADNNWKHWWLNGEGGDEWWGWWDEDSAGVGSEAVGGDEGSDERQSQGGVGTDEVSQVAEEGVCGGGL